MTTSNSGGDVSKMSVAEIEYQIALGRAIANLLDPIVHLLAVIAVGEREGFFTVIPEYHILVRDAQSKLSKLGEVSAVTRELQAHNEAYLKVAETEPRH